MATASNNYERSPGQRFQGRGIFSITEKHRPIPLARAKEVIVQPRAIAMPSAGLATATTSPEMSNWLSTHTFRIMCQVAGRRTTSCDNAPSNRGTHPRSANGNRSGEAHRVQMKKKA